MTGPEARPGEPARDGRAMVAGMRPDHAFVPADRAGEARGALLALSAG